MSMGGRFDAQRRDEARLVVQRTLGPVDRLLEASRGEVRQRHADGVEITDRLKGLAGGHDESFDCSIGPIAQRKEVAFHYPGGRGIRV